MKITVIGLLIFPLLVSCSLSAPIPSTPIVEFNGEICNIKYGSNSYKATVTHLFQGVTSITFIEPGELNGIVYSFSENGCNIMLGDLKFSTDHSFMGDTALPQVICDVLNNAHSENALTYSERNEPNASTLTTAVFTGKTSNYPYTLTTDFDSGYIKEITVSDINLTLTFTNR